MSKDNADDPIIAAIDRAASFSDRHWIPATRKLKPSQIIVFRYLMLIPRSDTEDAARRVARDWLAEQRAEWRRERALSAEAAATMAAA